MTKGFNDREKEQIREKLMNAAEECWGRYGMKKTSVDQLVSMANISKGSFYLFYETKEHLFMDTFERLERQMKEQMFLILQHAQGDKKENFREVIFRMYQEVKRVPWLLQLETGDLELLARKLPPERMQQHIAGDDNSTADLLKLLDIKPAIDPDIVSGALRGLFLLLLHKEELGEKHFDGILQFLLDAVVEKLCDPR